LEIIIVDPRFYKREESHLASHSARDFHPGTAPLHTGMKITLEPIIRRPILGDK
jgi:hypothetical protein